MLTIHSYASYAPVQTVSKPRFAGSAWGDHVDAKTVLYSGESLPEIILPQPGVWGKTRALLENATVLGSVRAPELYMSDATIRGDVQLFDYGHFTAAKCGSRRNQVLGNVACAYAGCSELDIHGNFTVSRTIDEACQTWLDNVTVNGETVLRGGGPTEIKGGSKFGPLQANSVLKIENSEVASIVCDGNVTLSGATIPGGITIHGRRDQVLKLERCTQVGGPIVFTQGNWDKPDALATVYIDKDSTVDINQIVGARVFKEVVPNPKSA